MSRLIHPQLKGMLLALRMKTIDSVQYNMILVAGEQ